MEEVSKQEMEEISIYVHIPFCKQKCLYCAFTSFCVDHYDVDEYVQNLCREIEKRKCKMVVKSIYFGGGTPSILNEAQFEKIVQTIYANFDVYEDAESTIEANPNSITEAKLLCWRKNRVNRISIGVQALSDKVLKKIGRLHNSKQALDQVKLARKFFGNVSADLIVGLESVDGKTLCGYAKKLLECGVKHISCYLLEVYENTPLFDMVKNKNYLPLDDDEEIASFGKLANYLVDQGFVRYEISNFALPGFESGHNQTYWKREEYLGFGLGAHSFVQGIRLENSSSFGDYYAGKQKIETLSVQEEIEEIIMLGLRCNVGVSASKLLSLGYDITKNEYYEEYLKDGIIKNENGTILLNDLFYHVSNTIICNLIP